MTTAALASTTAVANELVALCRAGRNLDAIAKLCSPKIVSVEPAGSEAMPAEMTGIDAIRQKNEWWFDNYEVSLRRGQRAFVGGDQFAEQYVFDTTFKPNGQRSDMTDMALYTVTDGKIVCEQFCYNAPEAQA